MGNQRGLVHRIERMLEDGVGDAFARVFGGSIVPQELESLLRREASDGVRNLPGDRFLVPNDYVITLSGTDFEKLSADRDLSAQAFARHLEGYIQEQGWQTYGEVVVRLEPSQGLHTGQYRARAVVNPDADSRPADPRASVPVPAPAQSNDAFSAERGAPMTDNPGYRRPEDEYYDAQYGRPADEPRAAAPEPPRPSYPPEQGYPPSYEQGYPPRPAYPDQGGQNFAPGYGQGYEQRPPAGYAPGYDQGYRPPPPPPPGYAPQAPYGPPPGGGYPPPAADYDYGRQAPRYEEPGYGRHESRPPYPEQPGYPQPGYGAAPYGRPEYGQQEYSQPDYGQPDYGRYGQGGFPPPTAPAPEYDYSQPPPAAGAAVTLQLDDGSGRTYQLREGANVIGRGQDAQFRLPDTGVSRRHVEIRWDGQLALLSDLNSTNGTTVNNAPVQEWQLADGDVIRLGHSEIIVRVH